VAERARGENVPDGYAGQLADYDGLTVTALELIAGASAEVVDAEGVIDLEGQQAAVTAGLERLRVIAPAGIPELDETESAQLFRSGQAMFMRNWPVTYRSLAQDLEGTGAMDVRVALLPGGSSVLGGQNLAVSAHSARPRAAQALIEFLTSDRSQQILFERGGLPATREVVYSDEAVRGRYPYVTTLADAIDRAVLRPAEPHYARYSEVFRAAVDGFLRQGTPLPADFQSQLADALQGRLAPLEDG
jgi:multiple sugar transport system substrate-binding protein